MNRKGSRAVTLTMPEGLLVQIDQLAKQDYATRSDILRQAALAYIRSSDLDLMELGPLPTKTEKSAKKAPVRPRPIRDYEKLAKKYPYVPPEDRKLLAFLDDNDRGRL